jgi:AcrR family transcriptional regulator
MDTAERLFANQGIRSVSLNEITIAAGQRNASALQYHFGSREGLITSILDRHAPALGARRRKLMDAAKQSSSSSPRPVAEAIVRPLAETLFGDWSDRAFLRIEADLATDPSKGRESIIGLHGPEAVEAHRLLLQRISSVPQELREERAWTAGIMVGHALADQAQPIDSRRRRSRRDQELYISNLVDMFLGVVLAPPSEETLALLCTNKARHE